MTPSKYKPESCEDVAAEWAIRHQAGMTPADRADFERWLAADPRHYAAFAEADLALSILNPPRGARQREQLRGDLDLWEQKRRIRRRRGQLLGFATIGLAAAAAVVFAFLPETSQQKAAPAPVAATMTVGPLVRTLADGSIVEINGNAEIAVDFTREVRGVRLLHGEAHFDVAKDAARPFVVSIGEVKVSAVGTGFNVRLEPTEVQILVTEGTVAILAPGAGTRDHGTGAEDTPVTGAKDDGRSNDNQTPGKSSQRFVAGNLSPDITVTAGYRTVVSLASDKPQPAIVAAVSREDMQRELAWRKIRFELSNATLEEAIALFNRKGSVQLAIGDSELQDRRISGIYWADNPTQFAELIESTLDIKAVRQGSGRIVFHKQ